MSKKGEKKLLRNEETVMEFRDKMSMQVFGLHEYELNPLQTDELDDWMNPIWKPVKTYKGDIVEVNKIGEVRSIENKLEYPIVYPMLNNRPNYPFARIKIENKEDYVQPVHRLVAQAFVPNPENKPEVNHIDGDKTNNWAGNLEWVTGSENIRKAFEIGLMKTSEDHPRAIYTNEQIRQVCELLQDRPDLSFKEISKITGVADYNVGMIHTRKNWINISKGYNFHVYDQKGENNPRSKYDEKIVRDVCELLQNRPDLTFEKISTITSMPWKNVAKIYSKETWKYISDNYSFPKRKTGSSGENNGNSKYTDEQIHQVCKLLDDVYMGKIKMTQQQIANNAGVSKRAVEHIKSGDIRTNIVENYKFYRDSHLS